MYFRKNFILQRIFFAILDGFLNQNISGASAKHRGEAVIRKHLRTFEENQISNIIRKTKGKRRLKFHQFYSAKKYPKGYA